MLTSIDFTEFDALLELKSDWEFEGSVVTKVASNLTTASLRAGVVQLSATLQRFTQLAFVEYSQNVLDIPNDCIDKYVENTGIWGNPSEKT